MTITEQTRRTEQDQVEAAEFGYVGALMETATGLHRGLGMVRPEQFSSRARVVYEAIQHQSDANGPTDFEGVRDYLEATGQPSHLMISLWS